MKLARSASAPRMLGCRGGGTPAFTVPANCDQPRNTLVTCRSMGRTLCGLPSTSQPRNPAERGSGLSRFSNNSRAATASSSMVTARRSHAQLRGQLRGRERLPAQRGPQVKLRGGPDHAGRAKTIHQVEDLLPIGS